MQLKKNRNYGLDLLPDGDGDDIDVKPDSKDNHPDKGGDDGGDGDGDDPGGKKTYSQEEIVQMQNDLKKANERAAALKKKLKAQNTPDNTLSEELSKRDTELKELRGLIKKMELEKEEASLKGKDESAKELYKASKRIEELEATVAELNEQLSKRGTEISSLSSKYQEQLNKLREEGLRSEIRLAAESYNALKPQQIVNLLRADFIYDTDIDAWVVPITNKKGEVVDGKSVEEYVKEYLTSPDNDNLIRSGVKGGTGDQPASSATGPKSTDKSKPTPSSGPIKMTDKIKKEALMRDMDPEVWLSLLNENELMRQQKAGK